jgi:hypothetical protein
MKRWGFRLQLAVLAASLAFILAMLAAYAWMGLRYLEGEGPGFNRRQLAHITAALRSRSLARLQGWLNGSRSAAASPLLLRPRSAPGDVPMPPFSLAGLYRASDQKLLTVWHPRPREPRPPPGFQNRPPPPNLPNRPPPGVPPREEEALSRLCQHAVRVQHGTFEFRTGLRDAYWFYAEPARPDEPSLGAVWCFQRISEAPIRDLSVWALPATILAALLGISLALWTAVNLQRSITRMQTGLEMGREMVASLMPAGCHTVVGYEIARRLEPATEVGGDFYNLFPIEGTRLAIVLGDISGTGVAAALYMAVVTTLLEEHALAGLPPAAVVGEVNERLQRRLRERRLFATAVYARLDPDEHRLTLCSAGQTPCIWLRAGGRAEYVKLPGPPLGRLGPTAYQEQTLSLEVGDTLVFATDGVIEVRNGKGGPLGYDGWLRLVQRYRDCDPHEMVDRLFAALRTLPPLHEERDDMTVLIIRRNGREGKEG